ncbi:uncharacterized protein LOC124641013 [Helicoverpa zea]|uniref:uncharacterized protein LOC124641013 n=1 Tax=Helicoverpa zea TaxID=7113 RepID=UPI001F568D15|nr:uncharacterized protein LOC124641013 [Helicoverpa zea]
MSAPRVAAPSAEEVPLVTENEVERAAFCLRGKKTAPGPDGVPAKLMAIATSQMGERFRDLFSTCLTSERFPKPWKEGQLCLLRKEGRPVDSPSAYRPIVLLDEVGKMFERVLAARINRHLSTIGPDIADAQFGFRAERSTVDALSRLKDLVKEAMDAGDGLLGVSFDIANAFNSIPHSTILEALRFHGVPSYLRGLLADYLRDRTVLLVDKTGQLRRYGVESGLTVALQKTEAVFFHGPRQHQPPDAYIHVEGVRIGVQPQMKYLGIVLDSKWHFSAHFSGLSTRLMKTAGALSWLLPNIGRPGDQCRRLYAGILKSMALYGAPIWAVSLCRRRNAAAIRRPQRVIAQRVARAYRTVSFAAACVLAGTPPWELEAWVLARVYDWKAAQRALDRHPDPIEREEVREEAREITTGHWAEDLASATFGRRTLDAIGPVLNGWLDRRHGCLSMRLVQHRIS